MEKDGFKDHVLRYSAPLVAVASLAVGGACSSERGEAPPAPPSAPATSPKTTIPLPADHCIEPTAGDIAATEALLAAPQAPEADLPLAGDKDDTAPQARHREFMQQVAHQEGVTIYNAEEKIQRLESRLYSQNVGPQPSFGYYLSGTNAFMNQLGVTVNVGAADRTYDYGGRAPAPDDLETDNAKGLLITTLRTFSDQPQEYVALQGLKNIILTTGTESQDVLGYVNIISEPGRIFLDINRTGLFSILEQGIRHEEGHLVDGELCGVDDWNVDEDFAALNHGQDVYRGIRYDSDVPALTHIRGKMSALLDNLPAPDKATACAIKKTKDQAAAKVLTPTEYHPDIHEEKAELLASVSDDNAYVDIANPTLTTLYPKFRYQAARLNRVAPRVFSYFAKTSRRPALPDPLAVDCPAA